MRWRDRAIAFAACAAALAACHHAPDEQVTPLDAAPPPPPPAADAAAPDEWVPPPTTRAFCDAAFTADVDRLRAKCATPDLALSQGAARAAANLCVRDIDGMLERGHVVFDQARADACVAMLRANTGERASETDTFFAHAPCDAVLAGRQEAGAPCLFPVECKEGLACIGYRVAIEGVCKPTPKTKEACNAQVFGATFNADAVGLHHPACGPSDWCDGKQCTPRVAAGKSCTASESCAVGLSCVMGRCSKRGAVGAACQKGTDCVYGLRCDVMPDAGPGKCAERKAEGAPCASPDECKGSCSTPASRGADAAAGKCVSVCGSG